MSPGHVRIDEIQPLIIEEAEVFLASHLTISINCDGCSHQLKPCIHFETPLSIASLDYVTGLAAEHLMEAVGKTVECRCGNSTVISSTPSGHLCHRFVDSDAHVHVAIGLNGRGKTNYSFEVFEAESTITLNNDVSDQDFVEPCGRVFNIGSAWNELWAEAWTSKGYYQRFAAPGYLLICDSAFEDQDIDERMRVVHAEINANFQGQPRAYSLSQLAMLPAEERDYVNPISVWAPGFSDLVAARGLVSFAFLDQGRFVECAKQKAHDLKLDLIVLSDDLLQVSNDGFRTLIHIAEALRDAVLMGWTLGEAATVATARSKIHCLQLREFFEKLSDAVSDMKVVLDEETRNEYSANNYVKFLDGDAVAGVFRLEALMAKMPDSGNLREWLQGMLRPNRESGMDFCEVCNEKRTISMVIKPKEIYSEKDQLLKDSWSNSKAVVIYTLDCAHANIFLQTSCLKDLQLTREQIRQQAHDNLAHITFHYKGGRKLIGREVKAVWVFGTNIASVVMDGRLVAGLLLALDVGWSGKVSYIIENTNGLAMFPHEQHSEAVDDAVNELRATMSLRRHELGQPMELSGNVEIMPPVGQFTSPFQGE